MTQATGTLDIRLKRAYDAPSADHGERVLVDRLNGLRALARKRLVTLIYAARDERHNEAVVLRDTLLATASGRRGPGFAPKIAS